MNAEKPLFLPGRILVHVTLLFGLMMAQPAGGKLFSNPSTIGGFARFTTEKLLLIVSLFLLLSPVPVLEVGSAVKAVIVCVPDCAEDGARFTVTVPPMGIAWLNVAIELVPLSIR